MKVRKGPKQNLEEQKKKQEFTKVKVEPSLSVGNKPFEN